MMDVQVVTIPNSDTQKGQYQDMVLAIRESGLWKNLSPGRGIPLGTLGMATEQQVDNARDSFARSCRKLQVDLRMCTRRVEGEVLIFAVRN